jgi:gluconate:H+ symporter, GntP family
MDPILLLLIGLLVVVGAIVGLRLPAFLALIMAALIVGALTPESALERFAQSREMSPQETERFLAQPLGARLARAFGNTCAGIGILIAMASIIGKCLLISGGADRIVRSTMRVLGERRAPMAFWGSGFVLSIPVFFDTVFYLLIPLGKALRLRTGRNYTLYVMAIITGATMTHSLVPPTPGPLMVANELGVDIGLMMMGGIVLGLITSLSGYLYAVWLNRRLDIPLRDTADTSLAELAEITRREDRDLPPLWLALLPIALPILLIAGHAVLARTVDVEAAAAFAGLLAFTASIGNPNVALAFAAGVAIAAMCWTRRHRPDNKPLAAVLEEALRGAGLIILITAAGGAFGAILQHTAVGVRIASLAEAYQVGILPLAWFVTVLLRTTQGSATVAMITSVGILAGVVNAAELNYNALYVALAIGCGSKPFSWMNDSGFWIIGRMSGMTIGETLKAFSVLQTVMAVVGLVAVMGLSRLFPLTF